MTNEIELAKLAFEGPNLPYRGFTIAVHYLHKPKGDALVEIFQKGELKRKFLYPAYKIYNLQAHFEDIVDGELEGYDKGYRLANWNGFGTSGIPEEVK